MQICGLAHGSAPTPTPPPHLRHHQTTHPPSLRLAQKTLAPPGVLGKGQYQYCFPFRLPPNLPSSFAYARGSTWANIRYKVEVVVHRPGAFTRALKSEQQLEVYGQLRSTPAHVVLQSAVGAGGAGLGWGGGKGAFHSQPGPGSAVQHATSARWRRT